MLSPIAAFWALLIALVFGVWGALLAPYFVRAAARGQHAVAVLVLYATGIIPAIAVLIDRTAASQASGEVSWSPTAVRILQTQTALLAAAAFLALLSALTGARMPRRRWLTPLIIYGFVVTLAALFAGAFKANLLLFPGAVFAAASCWATPTEVVIKHGRIILRALVLASLVLYVARPYYVFLPNSEPRFLGKQLAGLALEPNAFGMLATLALILELYSRRSRMSLVWFSFALTALVLSQSRSGWLAGLVGVLVWSSGRFGKPRTIALVAIASLIGWTLVGARISQTGLHGRENVWPYAWQVFQDNPLIGGGPDGLRTAIAGSRVESFGAQAHNQLLDSLAKTGLVGVVLLLSFFIRSFQRALLLLREGYGVAVAILAALTARSLFESPIDTGFPVMLLVALLACRSFTPSNSETPGPSASQAEMPSNARFHRSR